eukprot:scaffold343758_cov32-Prasinocladus_malaysianus.AAC.1
MPRGPCTASRNHAGNSHRTLTLEERVGPKAAETLRTNMEGTPHSWMLNLSAEVPPQPALDGLRLQHKAATDDHGLKR